MNIFHHKTTISPTTRSQQKNQKPITFWFTGLSSSGKSTLANELEKYLVSQEKHTMLLDGDNIRLGLNNDLGFSSDDRTENIRRIAEVSKLFNEAGIICIVSTISPMEKDRNMAYKIIGKDNFIEIYISTPLEECKRRDPKNLYKEVAKGNINNFTGIHQTYEVPQTPEIEINTANKSINESVNELINKIQKFITL